MEKQQVVTLEGTSQYRDDEVDLFSILEELLAEKKIILLTFIAVLGLSIFYAYHQKPSYRATAYVVEPLSYSVQPMNALNQLTRTGIAYSTDKVFSMFLNNLSSRASAKAVFIQDNLDEIYAPMLSKLSPEEKKKALNSAVDAFDRDFVVQDLRKNPNGGYGASVSLLTKASPDKVAKIVNDAVAYAQRKTIDDIFNSIMSEYDVEVQKLNDKVLSARKTAEDRRLDKIARLNEAIKIARQLKISEPKQMGQSVTVSVGQETRAEGRPLYYMGYKFLEAEKASLEHRKNDDPFIPGLRDLQERLVQLKELNLNKGDYGVVRIDQPAFSPTSPEKPKKKVIVAIGAILGLILGVMIVLTLRGYRNHVKATRAN